MARALQKHIIKAQAATFTDWCAEVWDLAAEPTEPTNQLKEAQRCLTDAAHLSHLAEIVSEIEIENITGDLDALAVQRDTHPEEPALRTLWAASVVNFITK